MRVTLSDPANLGAALDASFVRFATMAWQEWSAKTVTPDVTIAITVTDTIPTAAAPAIADGVLSISINPVYWLKYIDQNPAYVPGDPIAAGKDAPDYVFLHEEGHGLGINHTDMAPYTVGAFFTGPHAMAAYGGPVPLTQDGYEGHLSNSLTDGLTFDIMSGVAPNRSFTQAISVVDLAILKDVHPVAPPSVLAELYAATFGRAPDAPGLAYWTAQHNGGMSLPQIAQSFFAQPEAQAAFANGHIVEVVFERAFGHAPDPAGLAYWTQELASGHVREGEFVLAVINGAQGADAQHLIDVVGIAV